MHCHTWDVFCPKKSSWSFRTYSERDSDKMTTMEELFMVYFDFLLPQITQFTCNLDFKAAGPASWRLLRALATYLLAHLLKELSPYLAFLPDLLSGAGKKHSTPRLWTYISITLSKNLCDSLWLSFHLVGSRQPTRLFFFLWQRTCLSLKNNLPPFAEVLIAIFLLKPQNFEVVVHGNLKIFGKHLSFYISLVTFKNRSTPSLSSEVVMR